MSKPSSHSSEPSSTHSTPTSEDLLHQLVQARYPDDPGLQEHVLESARKAGTVDRIVSGELSLPHPEDARRDLERVQRQQERQGG